MTLVLRPDGFRDVRSPVPACVQEYVDHGAALYKVYVIGSEVRWRLSAEEVHDMAQGMFPCSVCICCSADHSKPLCFQRLPLCFQRH